MENNIFICSNNNVLFKTKAVFHKEVFHKLLISYNQRIYGNSISHYFLKTPFSS